MDMPISTESLAALVVDSVNIELGEMNIGAREM